jgi:hypothetical protein
MFLACVPLAAGIAVLVLSQSGHTKTAARQTRPEPGARPQGLSAPVLHHRCRTANPSSPMSVTLTFLYYDVLRKDAYCGYSVVVRSLHGDMTRRQWGHGSIQVQPCNAPGIPKWRYDVKRGSTPTHLLMLVGLSNCGGTPALFDMELVKRHGSWKVSYWIPHNYPRAPSG